jgi:serine/threonine-protein kinase
MAFSPAQLLALSALVDTMQALPVDERATWLATLTEEQAEFRPMLARLLAQEENVETANFLSTLPKLGEWSQPNASELSAGTEVGPYRLIRELGHGGMGTVWLAERSDGILKRTVALKLPHSALPQRQLAERFARERDILAALTHPNIARLYDAGVTAQGQPYLALEFVEGEPLLESCDRCQLGLRERITLFLQVLNAVQYAHGQLVVHRDLKPSNILVTQEGDVKLLDFGIAKLLIEGQANETELTQLGGRALTLQYASPEQITGQALGTASDVYSLGVVLYELLTGSLPYRLKRDSRGALEEAILSADPTRPSQTEVLIGNAEVRASTTKRLATALRGDLDTIILKALKKAASERYATPALFAEDLRRNLAGEVVLARPDSTWYRTRKFVRRNWLAVGAVVAVMLALAVGLGIALWQAQVARQEAQTARDVQAFLQGIFQANSSNQVDPVKARQTTAREMLDIGAKKIDSSLGDAPGAKIETLKTLAQLYMELGLSQEAADLQRKRIAFLRVQYGSNSVRVAEGLLDLALALSKRLDDPDWEHSLTEAQSILDRRGDTDPLLRARLYSCLSAFYGERDLGKAADFGDRALTFYRKFPLDREFLAAVFASTNAHVGLGEWLKARSILLDAVAQTSLPKTNNAVADLMPELYSELGVVEFWLDHVAEAEAAYTQAWERSKVLNGNDDISTIDHQADYANLLILIGRGKEGVEQFRNAVKAFRRLKGADEPLRLSEMLEAYGNGLSSYGAVEEANQAMGEAVEIVARAGDTLRLAMLMGEQADILVELGRTDEALKLLDSAQDTRARSPRPDIVGNLHDEMTRLKVLLVQHRRAEANELAGRLLQNSGDAVPVNPKQKRGTDYFREWLALENGNPKAALDLAQRTIDDIESSSLRNQVSGSLHVSYLMAGKALFLLGRSKEAEIVLRKALELATLLFDPAQSLKLADTQIALANCQIDLRGLHEAQLLAQKARAIQLHHKQSSDQYREALRTLEARLKVGGRAEKI